VQKDRESFKEYAQRWREKAAEVYPPVTDNELCSLFIETLKAPYFNLMIENTSNSFSDIIQAGERIEANLRMGRLQELSENPVKKAASLAKRRRVMCIPSPGRTIIPHFLKITTNHTLPLMAKPLQTSHLLSQIIHTRAHSTHHLQITNPDRLLLLLNLDHPKIIRDHQETLIHLCPSHSTKYTDTSSV